MLLANSLAAALPLLALPLTALPARGPQQQDAPAILEELDLSQDDTREVVATGVGADEEGARRDTRRSALEMAVGALIDAETRLKNNEVIEEIISASAGFIESYEELSSKKRDDGLWQVQARVVVRKNLLRKRLVTSKVITEKVDGGSLFAKAMSKASNKEATAAIIAKNMADYPLCAMKVEMAGEPEILTNEGDRWAVGLKVAFTVDPEGWEKSAKLLRTALSNIASRHAQVDPRWERRNSNPKFDHQGWLWQDDSWSAPSGRANNGWHYDLTEKELKRSVPLEADEFLWAVPTNQDINCPWDVYAVPRSLLPELGRISAREVNLIVELKDSNDSVIHRVNIAAPCAPYFPVRSGEVTYPSGLGFDWASGFVRPNMLHRERLPEDSGYGSRIGPDGLSRYSPLLSSGFTFLPNWVCCDGSARGRSPVERATVRIATEVDPQILNKTQAIELRLESSFTAGLMAYQPRSDSKKTKSVWLEPLESESGQADQD